MNTEQTSTATQTPTHKTGRPRKYHTAEEYAEARKRYYEARKLKIKTKKAEQREEFNIIELMNNLKSDEQKEIERMLVHNVYAQEQMTVLLEILKNLSPQITPNIQEEAPQQNDTDC